MPKVTRSALWRTTIHAIAAGSGVGLLSGLAVAALAWTSSEPMPDAVLAGRTFRVVASTTEAATGLAAADRYASANGGLGQMAGGSAAAQARASGLTGSAAGTDGPAAVAGQTASGPARGGGEARYAAAIAQIERLIAHEMQDKGLPAVSIALVDDQEIVWAKGFGQSDPARQQPATADTIYRVGSVSKLFTDIGVMQLVERGDVDLDTPVTTWLPDFKPANPFGTPITLRHLMSHRAGLVREPPVGHYFDDTSPTLAQTVASLNRTTLVYAPGTRTKYSNAGIAVVGRVLEVIAKRPFADVLQQRVIAPLGLRQSAFVPPGSAQPRRAAAGARPGPGSTKGAAAPAAATPAASGATATATAPAARGTASASASTAATGAPAAGDVAKARMWTYHGTTFEAPTFQLGMAPAGSMYSTVTDLGRFMSVLFRGGAGPAGPVLKPETLEAMWVPQSQLVSPPAPPPAPPPASAVARASRGPGAPSGGGFANQPRSRFGLGFDVSVFEGQRRVGHSGAIYGFATDLQALPDRKLGVAISTTLDCVNPVMTHIAQEALRAMLRVRDGRPQADLLLPAAVAAEDAKRLAGRYAADTAGRRLTLQARGGRLIASLANIQADVKAAGTQLLIDGRLAYGAFLTPRADGAIEFESRPYRKLPDSKPAPAPAAWTGLIGEYGWDHDVLYVLEHEGRLHALIEWFYLYPLEQVGPDRFAFPKSGLYDGEELRFIRGRAAGPGSASASGSSSGGASASGSASTVTAVDISGVTFARRPTGGMPAPQATSTSTSTFRITPLKPIAELRTIAAAAVPPVESGKRAPDLVELSSLDPTITYDIRYATTNNFMSAAFYRQARALMQRPAAEAVARAHRALKAQGYGLLIHDAYRPWTVTKMFWEATPLAQRVFVADPSQGSRHNRGCAVDLTLYDLATGAPIQMVGGYDEFSDRSYPEYPGGTSLQRWHRELLRRTMEAEGFTVYDAEWWHFDFDSWRDYPILNIPFEQLPAVKAAA